MGDPATSLQHRLVADDAVAALLARTTTPPTPAPVRPSAPVVRELRPVPAPRPPVYADRYAADPQLSWSYWNRPCPSPGCRTWAVPRHLPQCAACTKAGRTVESARA